MNVIFLDVDGVLNSGEFIKSKRREKSPCGFIGIDDICVERLSRLVKETQSSLILSSTWRILKDEDRKYLDEKLNKYDLKIFDETTTEISEDNRGNQIKDWLDRNSSKYDNIKYLILDDSFFESFLINNVETNFIQTKWETGLTDEDVQKGIDFLKNDKPLSNMEYYDMEGRRFGRQ